MILIISLTLISGGIFYLFNITAPEPGMSSGNGNPAILFLFILIPIGIILIFLWNYLLKIISPYKRVLFSILLVIVGYWVYGVYHYLSFQENYREAIKAAYLEKSQPVDEEFITDLSSSFLSMSSNVVYFNLNTFILFMLSIIFLSIIFYLVNINTDEK